jgi:hypothetical protein
VAVDAFENEVMADGPVGYWRLGESPGQLAKDLSPKGNHGTYNGGITLGLPGFHGGIRQRCSTALRGSSGSPIVRVSIRPASRWRRKSGGTGRRASSSASSRRRATPVRRSTA